MNALAILALLNEIVAVAPGTFKTGKQVFDLVNSGYASIKASIKDDATPEEINALVKKIVANSIKIQGLD